MKVDFFISLDYKFLAFQKIVNLIIKFLLNKMKLDFKG